MFNNKTKNIFKKKRMKKKTELVQDQVKPTKRKVEKKI